MRSHHTKHMLDCCRDMLDASPGVSWGDIAGLAEAKRVLQENVILPLYMPDYFQGIRRPVKVSSHTCSAASVIFCLGQDTSNALDVLFRHLLLHALPLP